MDIPRLFVGTLLLVGLFVLYDAWGTTPSSADVVVVQQQQAQEIRDSRLENKEPLKQETQPQQYLPESVDNRVLVTRVIDGDTIEIESGERVRYIGVNTPESVDPRKKVQCFGKEAANENKKLVEGKYVRLEADIEDKDRYGRLLRYVWIGSMMVNEQLVRDGYAQLMTIPPNIKYVERFKIAQASARGAKRGLWAKCRK